MIADASTWLDAQSGAGLVAWAFCALCILVGLVIAGAEYIPPAWRWSRRKLAQWHAAQVRAANEPTRFEDRDESAGNVALVVTLAFCALIAAILWGTR